MTVGSKTTVRESREWRARASLETISFPATESEDGKSKTVANVEKKRRVDRPSGRISRLSISWLEKEKVKEPANLSAPDTPDDEDDEADRTRSCVRIRELSHGPSSGNVSKSCLFIGRPERAG